MYALLFIGGVVFEFVLGWLFKKYKIASIVKNDATYLKAKADALLAKVEALKKVI